MLHGFSISDFNLKLGGSELPSVYYELADLKPEVEALSVGVISFIKIISITEKKYSQAR